MGYPCAHVRLLTGALLATALVVPPASAREPSAREPELSWGPDNRLRVGGWRFDPETMWFSAARGEGDDARSVAHPSSSYGRSEPQRAVVTTDAAGAQVHTPPPAALAEPGGARHAWIESRCETWDGGGVVRRHVCVFDPAEDDPRICFEVPRERLLEELDEQLAATPEQHTAMLDRLFAREQQVHILHTESGAPACRVRTLGAPSAGEGTWSASLFHETTGADGCVRHRSVSLTIGPCTQGRCEATYSGPGGSDECPDGTSRGFGVGEFWTVSVDHATDTFLAIGGERWFLDRAACERAAAAERALDWPACAD